MISITADDWNNLNSENPQQIGLKIQNEINQARRKLERGLAEEYINTQSEYYESINPTEAESVAGISSLKRLALATDDSGAVTERLDSQAWVEPTDQLVPGDLVTVPSSKTISIPDWISYIRNNMISLNEYEQMADRISLLANDVETNEGVSIDKGSLATFIMFLSSNKIEKRPSIGLTSNGYIDALWRGSTDLLVEIVFLPGHESQIVTFSPDLVNLEIIYKRVATLPISNIMGVISSRNLDALLWSKKYKTALTAA